MNRIFLLVCLVTFSKAHTQKSKREDRQITQNLQAHAAYLANDKLEGRRTGSRGEDLAAIYISDVFKKTGLAPKGTEVYLQPFEIVEGKKIGKETRLRVEGRELALHEDFFPFPFSADGSVEAAPSVALQESDMPWFWNLSEAFDNMQPHSNLSEIIKNKADEVQKKGATALFVYNTGTARLPFDAADRTATAKIPVLYLTHEAMQKYLSDESATVDVGVTVRMGIQKRWGKNVVAWIDNGAPNTVILGAHYDHLGWGEDGNSLSRDTAKQIHNGADDNASGTAALLELARIIKGNKLKNNNYLFIAFSGEELGLFGSKYFTENPTINLQQVNYMINMDMVGRLNDSGVVNVGGIGTSPAWSSSFTAAKTRSGGLLYRFDSSGVGPSDHTSFYRKGIPVLFYFTGLHSDYHRPTDDAEKLNLNGTTQIIKQVFALVQKLDKEDQKIVFTKTAERQMGTSARFSVTLGIMPDYTFSGSGVRVDGVTEGRVAAKAGLQPGDIIVKLGDATVNSMETYMQALALYKKGDSTQLTVQRGQETFQKNIVFE